MVSKRQIYRKSPLIVVTVGTTLFPFTRLFETIDKCLCTQKTDTRLVLQASNSNYIWSYKHIEAHQSLPPEALNTLFKKATHIITHGGFGTIHTLTTLSSVMPLIVARNAKYQEHVDNHQRYFLDYCKSNMPEEYKQYFVTKNNLFHPINEYLRSNAQENLCGRYLFNQNKQSVIKALNDYLATI